MRSAASAVVWLGLGASFAVASPLVVASVVAAQAPPAERSEGETPVAGAEAEPGEPEPGAEAEEPGGAQPDGPEEAEPGDTEEAVADEGPDAGGAAGLESPGVDGDAPAATESPRAAVLVLAADASDAGLADGLSEVLLGAVAAARAGALVGKEELQAQLQQSDDRATLECFASPACVGQLAVRLRVGEVVVATLERQRAPRWTFALDRLDARSGELVRRVFREGEGDVGDVAEALQEAVGALYAEAAPAPPRLRIRASVPGAEVRVDGRPVGTFRAEPLEVEGLTPGSHEVEVRAPEHRPWTRELTLEAGAVLELDAGLVPEPSEAVPPPPIDPAPAGPRVSPVLWVGVGAAALGGALAIGFGVLARIATRGGDPAPAPAADPARVTAPAAD